MKRWFAALPLQRKLIAMALAVSAVALVAALAGLIAFDVVRFRDSAADDAHALAQVIAGNSAAAIVFNDADAAQQMLSSVRVRPMISRACVYRADGTLLARFERPPAVPCPVPPADARSWRAVASVVPVERNGQSVGAIYIERQLGDLPGRVLVTTLAGVLMLLVAAAVAFLVATRMQANISRPIVSLAGAAREIGRDDAFTLPAIDAPPDETGALVQAFSDMVGRLTSSNQALKAEIEERRRMQAEREALLTREREANRLKDEFLAAVSHELRTPLNAIMGWTQLLGSMPPTEQMLSKAVASLSRNAEAQKRVIEDLLDVSRIITGKLQLRLSAVDLRAAVESAIDVVAPIAAAKNIAIDTDLPRIPAMVQGDMDRLRQILWNLLSNALKFTPGGGAVTVSIAEDDETISLAIADTGPGITSDFLPHVFERFRQADGSTTREHGGLGLGLALVKELTELHGGTVAAASGGPGRGASFTLRFPRLIERAEPPANAGRIAVAPRLDSVDVLAVDDNRDALDVISSALTAVGAQVRTAESGADALTQIERRAPAILLCDLAMPGMDGFELLASVRRQDAQLGRVPTRAVAVTAYVSDEYRERCRNAGFQGYVAKPYTTTALIREMAAVLAAERNV